MHECAIWVTLTADMKRIAFTVARLAVAILSVVAILSMIIKAWDVPGFSLANVLSYFTVQSNVIAGAVLLLAVVASYKGRRPWTDRVRGAGTLYIVITGVIYHLLLRDADVGTATDWINMALHTVAPLYLFMDWLIDPPKQRISFRRSLVWLGYPLLYTAYTLVRGELAGGWYPYPFIDVAQYGYAQVAANSLVMLAGFVILAAAVAFLPRLVGKLIDIQASRLHQKHDATTPTKT